MSSAPEPSAAARAAARAARALPVRVEASGALAVLVPLGDAAVDWASHREEVVRLARQHGFSHVAVELSAEPAGQGSPPARDGA